MAPVAAAACAVAAARVVGLAVVAAAAPAPAAGGGGGADEAVAVEPGEDGGEEEEDAVHDAEGEAGLEHGAGLVGVDADAVAVEGAENAKGEVVRVAAADVGAVGAGDEAEVVDARYEGTDEGCDAERGVGLVTCSLWLVLALEWAGEGGGALWKHEPYQDRRGRRSAHWRCSCDRRRG